MSYSEFSSNSPHQVYFLVSREIWQYIIILAQTYENATFTPHSADMSRSLRLRLVRTCPCTRVRQSRKYKTKKEKERREASSFTFFVLRSSSYSLLRSDVEEEKKTERTSPFPLSYPLPSLLTLSRRQQYCHRHHHPSLFYSDHHPHWLSILFERALIFTQ